MLYPLVESCLPEEVLRVWERSHGLVAGISPNDSESQVVPTQSKLTQLMTFLRREVDSEQRIVFARTGLQVEQSKKKQVTFDDKPRACDVPTAAGLYASSQPTAGIKSSADNISNENNTLCLFCERQHLSQDCRQSKKLSLQEKRGMLTKRGVCFVCLRPGHVSKNCRSKVFCPLCDRRHYLVLCPELDSRRQDNQAQKKENTTAREKVLTSSADQHVLLQTLFVILACERKEFIVRALIDTGSQRSYISERVADMLKCERVGERVIVHSLFGGIESGKRRHQIYQVTTSSLDGTYNCDLQLLSQPKLCGKIPRVSNEALLDEIRNRGIFLTDIECFPEPSQLASTDHDIDLLLGADVAGQLLTGQVQQLDCGPVAVETRLGWTLMGRITGNIQTDSTLLVTSLFVHNASVTDLWSLDSIGIREPLETKTKNEVHNNAMDHFLCNLKRNPDGRYEVALPWAEGHPPLPDNRRLAEKRLQSCHKKLEKTNMLQTYHKVLDDWLQEGITEIVPMADKPHFGHYLPHRPVIKTTNVTTKVRPVFDASAQEGKMASLNDCLEKGPNLLELLPTILTRFRMHKVGIIADIKQAFLQIGIREQDRDYLRFLWYDNDKSGVIKEFRHRRVVFGVTTSPFLLCATLSFHLDQAAPRLKNTADKLKESFYVDNCVASLREGEDPQDFIHEAQALLSTAHFDLRDWTYNGQQPKVTGNIISVLGLSWNVANDTLSCDLQHWKDLPARLCTKRNLLSCVHHIFDPLGFTCPVTLRPKLLLQEAWKLKTTWDQELPPNFAKLFDTWVSEVPLLSSLSIPRRFTSSELTGQNASLHVFCDASNKAYATCIYLRQEERGVVTVQLVQARSRVAPVKPITIPRLELLACCIGARLANSVHISLKLDIPTTYWTDSTNALAWIQSNDKWKTFVWNRVTEIRSLSEPKNWRHISGDLNPADTASRGVSVHQLVAKRWWEGPDWLQLPMQQWPSGNQVDTNNTDVQAERQHTTASLLSCTTEPRWYIGRFSSYLKVIRMVAWIYRFLHNTRTTREITLSGELTVSEVDKAELFLFKCIQSEAFKGIEDDSLRTLRPMLDSEGILRVKTQLVLRKDHANFKFPIILPSKHPLVDMLILWRHRSLCHAGVGILLADLRERFWILKGRKTISQILRKCIRCKRFEAKRAEAPSAVLPADRVTDTAVFAVTGIDLLGPLFLKGGQKSWVVLFTCAVVRAIHLELVTSLSTNAFLQALRRFVARRGRPDVVYSDNGTNFTGAEAQFATLDWQTIATTATTQRIQWKFNPPSAPWWGGWWERLVGMVKRLLRRVLGRTSLVYEELYTVLCDCESVINARPLTYIAENTDDLRPLTPAMFLQDIRSTECPDLDIINQTSLDRKLRCRQQLVESLRKRFRSEYLGQLRQPLKSAFKSNPLKVGDVVMLGDDITKRLTWPLAKIEEIFPDREGNVRVVKVRTARGTLIRPIQKLFPLEIRSPYEQEAIVERHASSTLHKKDQLSRAEQLDKDKVPKTASTTTTRSGRVVKPPKRLQF